MDYNAGATYEIETLAKMILKLCKEIRDATPTGQNREALGGQCRKLCQRHTQAGRATHRTDRG